VVNCGDENLKYFLEKAGKNATYTSKDAAIVDLTKAHRA